MKKTILKISHLFHKKDGDSNLHNIESKNTIDLYPTVSARQYLFEPTLHFIQVALNLLSPASAEAKTFPNRPQSVVAPNFYLSVPSSDAVQDLTAKKLPPTCRIVFYGTATSLDLGTYKEGLFLFVASDARGPAEPKTGTRT
ncbi:hypothetical protein Trydic_g12744 [Trypoxylus dichotomus]